MQLQCHLSMRHFRTPALGSNGNPSGGGGGRSVFLQHCTLSMPFDGICMPPPEKVVRTGCRSQKWKNLKTGGLWAMPPRACNFFTSCDAPIKGTVRLKAAVRYTESRRSKN